MEFKFGVSTLIVLIVIFNNFGQQYCQDDKVAVNRDNSLGSDMQKRTSVPNIFPTNEKKYKILSNNETLINKLLHADGKASEISDLISTPLDSNDSITPNNSEIKKNIKKPTLMNEKLVKSKEILQKRTTTTLPPDSDEDYYEDDDESLKEEVEEVQEREFKTPKIELEEQFARSPQHEKDFQIAENIEIETTNIKENRLLSHSFQIGLIAGVITVACIGTYFVLVLWRRQLELKYGMRERLVNDDYDEDHENDVENCNSQTYRNLPSHVVREKI